MKILRFMSAGEALLLFAGATLENHTDHKAAGQYTNSVGFCFAVVDKDEINDISIHRAASRLSGVALLQVALIGTLTPKALRRIKASYGRYSSGMEDERCTTKYSLDDFKEWSMYVPTDQSTLFAAVSTNWEIPQYILCEQDRC